MPQCKMSNCREPALTYGKQYCTHHMAEYLRKQCEYKALQDTLRKCECCYQPLSKTRHDAEETLCGECYTRQTEENRADALWRIKNDRFNNATTVDELKSWIAEYLL